MPRVFRFKCQFQCRKCRKKTWKMGSCQPKECPACGAKKGAFDTVKQIDLKK